MASLSNVIVVVFSFKLTTRLIIWSILARLTLVGHNCHSLFALLAKTSPLTALSTKRSSQTALSAKTDLVASQRGAQNCLASNQELYHSFVG